MEFLTYLAKASLFTILFYGFYALLIRRTTFFHLNRAYLVLSLAASFLLPLLKIEEKVVIHSSPAAISNPLTDEIAVVPVSIAGKAATEVSAVQVFLGIYFFGAAVFLVLLLARLLKTFRLLRSYSPVLSEDIPVILLDGRQTGSFSFLNRIFISRPDFEHHFDTVYNHEKIHVSQRHSLDILLAELCRVFLWFNPVIKLYKNALQEVHEFLADTSATDRESYARFLVSYAMSGNYPPAMTNSFFNSMSLKKRIEMLYKKPDPGYALTRYLLIIPIAALLVALTAPRHYVYASTGNPPIDIPSAENQVPVLVTYEKETLPAAKKDDRVISGRVTDAADNTPLPGATILAKGLTFGTTTNSEGFYNLTVPANHQEIYVSFVGFKSQTIGIGRKDRIDIALSKNQTRLEELVVVGYGFADKAKSQPEAGKTDTSSVLKVVEAMPEFPGGTSQLYRFLRKNIRYPGEAAQAHIEGRVYVSFVINKQGYIRNPKVLQGLGYGIDEEALRVVVSMPQWNPGRQNDVPVDVEYTLPINFQLNPEEENKQGHAPLQLSPESENLTDTPRIQIRGAETLPKDSYFSSRYELSDLVDKPRTGFPRDENAPLYLVDGKEKYSLDGLDANTIASIAVLKKGNLAAEYGPRAKNGVVLITLKK